MSSIPRTVLVLGAGFTKAFVPNAPLLTDDFGADELAEQFREFSRARRILDMEVRACDGCRINIERLMTRLDGGMPYDGQHDAESELALLLKKLKENFVKRVRDATDEQVQDDDLARFADGCVRNSISCVTFNYDDVFDRAMWEVNRLVMIPHPETPYWHPDGGYGFFCRGSFMAIEETPLTMDKTSMLLLKLHGSLNWRSKLGSRQPFCIDDILHHESWMPTIRPLSESEILSIEQHLNPEPFIVPPVLVKSSLVREPILQYVWSLAYKVLAEAEQVIFVGYSFPVTDMAARFLFTETLVRERPADIKVVNTEEEEEAVRQAYRTVFPGLFDSIQFDFQGALDWSREFVAAVSADKPASG